MTFATSLATFLDEYFAHHPHVATSIGEHRHDHRWPDLSEAGRRERLAWVRWWRSFLSSVPEATLTADERIDRDLLLDELAALAWAEDELREETWNPLEWVYLVGFGLFPLTGRSFAPLADRLASFAGRLERLPAVFEQAREAIGSHPSIPVGRLHVDMAARSLPGLADLWQEAIAQGEAAAPDDPAVAQLLPRLRAAAELADREVEAFGAFLQDAVIPRATGDGLLGPERFATKLRHTLRDPAADPATLLARAEHEFTTVRAEMLRIARRLWPAWRPDEPLPDDDGALVRGVLDAISADHPGPTEVVDWCVAELERIEAFCRARDLIGLADEPLDIRWTPAFLRSFAGAMLDSPGPLDKGEKAFFSITPVADDWPPERVESYLREDNRRQLQLLTIHEAVPGHYLQGVYANRCSSIVRAVFSSGLFAEGWAVYVTQVMMDVGYGGDDLALWLVHWKFYLRAVTNAIIDNRIHTAGMTTDEAVRFMVEGGFQEEAEARAKDDRARLTSTQLSTYFVGSLGMWDLEDEVRRRAAAAAGAPGGRDAVPVPAVVGGYGETPGFRYRDHLEACIGHGAPPIPLLRRVLLED